jgi:hypothetical protein
MIFSVKSVEIRKIRGKTSRLVVFHFPFQVDYEDSPSSADNICSGRTPDDPITTPQSAKP